MQPVLSTDPGSGIPAALRRKPVDDEALKSAKGHAAGVMFVAPNGDILLLRRGGTPGVDNYVGHWGLPGGGVEEGETPEIGADREVDEEMGVRPEGKKRLLDRRITPNGMAFHTFAHPVAEKFVPKLNDEHTGYAWAPLDMLPQPLHPAIQKTLTERLGTTADMKPDDLKGISDGFLKWASQEEDEPEHALDSKVEIDVDDDEGQLEKLLAYINKNSMGGHSFDVVVDPGDPELAKKFYIDGDGAFRIREIKIDGKKLSATDSALTLALDRDSVREKDHDGRMKVKTANISKATVNPYLGEEIPGWEELGLDPKKIYQMLRDPEELRKAAGTFNGVQLLRKHIPVSADDHQPYDVVGTTGTDAKFEDPFLTNSLHVWTKEAIDEIESDGKKELSCGYHYRPEMTPGNFDGMPYDGIMRDIVGNHVALVKDGRAGPDVVVGDSMERLQMSKPTRLAALTLGLTAAAISPLLAKDAKIELPKALFNELTTKNFGTKKVALLAGVRQAADGKLRKGLAMDASMEHVGKVLDTVASLYETEKGADESVSEPQHKAMEAAANGKSDIGIPENVGEEFVSKDAEPFKNFLKEKGVSDEDIDAAMDLMPKAAAPGAADADETEEEKKKREESEKKAADEKADLEGKLAAKDNEMKDMVKKPAMDAAIASAVKTVRETERGIRMAIDEVRPWVGELKSDLVFDSAADVRGKALEILGVDTKGVDPSAFGALLKMAPLPGAKPAQRGADLALDSASTKKIYDKFPGLEAIGQA